ncbi:MAG TPA: AlkA N-terminal domain-containing protein [Acidimicrobiales bacterium]|nr:AlkA N-terminal domain-containing protein [Acidimicrobiales bacterium]
MLLDQAACYQALSSRDARFDGRFFTGVKTTGIYCRPVCPARLPLARNVVFFSHAAAAEDAGFRPCLRCRPETAPGSPPWLGSTAVVGRAIRLINDGAMDDADTQALAERLGMSGRQLARLFVAHVGAPPGAVARARRTHFARRLLDDTDLPLAQVAFAAGFGSVRQFNAEMKRTFQRTPTEMRGGRRKAVPAGDLTLRLAYRPPFDWESLAGHLRARVTPGVETIGPDGYRRTVSLGGTLGTIHVRPAPAGDHLLVTLDLPSPDHLVDVTSRVRRLFDLDADPMAVADDLGRDPVLGPLVAARPGLRMAGAWDGFELAVRAVLGQQVSVAAATTLAGRLAATYGKPIEGREELGLDRVFPEPADLVDADLTSIGVTRTRSATINGLAEAVVSGRLAIDASLGLDDLVARMCELPGIGPWTANYVAARACGEPDGFPTADLGLLKATGLGRTDLARAAEAWRPWRAYAAQHLWMSLTDTATKETT